MQYKKRFDHGFTLIELSIVLVIIGLIVGGVLVGQDLVRAAGVRATVTQVERFNTAVNTFYSKYGALPGDMSAATAAQLGFTTRSGASGKGDGNGIIENGFAQGGNAPGLAQGNGETAAFWVDLTTANGLKVNLIDGSFSAGTGNGSTSQVFDSLFPQAKIGNGNYFYVYSNNGGNYYGLSVPTNVNSTTAVCTLPGLTVQQAYQIDTKMDDGLPQTGTVTSQSVVYDVSQTAPAWAAGSTLTYGGCGDNRSHGADPGTSAAAAISSCYDNGATAANPMKYSLSQSGANINCALSFKFQ